jgi:hypothetical protein
MKNVGKDKRFNAGGDGGVRDSGRRSAQISYGAAKYFAFELMEKDL